MLAESSLLTAALALIGFVPANRLPPVPEQRGPFPGSERPRDSLRRGVLEPARNFHVVTPQNEPDNSGNSRHSPVDASRPKPPACTQDFIDWLRQIDEHGELTQRRLLSLYAEYCEEHFAPVTPTRLLRQIGACGVEQRRVATRSGGKTHQHRVYWLPRQRLRRAA